MKTTARLGLPLAATLLILGCADLALEADLVPAVLELSADRILIREGESANLDVIVKDQNGDPMDLPSWAPVKWTVTNPAVAEVAEDGSISTLSGGETYVKVQLGKLGDDALLLVNPAEVALSAPVIYLNQAVQNRGGDVRLLAGRQALVRVFMIGDQVSYYGPSVRITMILDGEEVFKEVVPQASVRTPDRVDESELDNSMNALIPASVIQPGVRMIVELDPEGVVPLKQGSQTRYPPTGSTALAVSEVPLYRQIMVPSVGIGAADSSIIDWAESLDVDHLDMRLIQSLLPISEIKLEIRETFRTGYDLTDINNWAQWRQDIGTMHVQEGRRGYYYGVVNQPASGLLGWAFLAFPASIGVNWPDVYTHEVGHNVNLYHAPNCGAGGPDPNYPHPLGSIGHWGYDFHQKQLKDPADFFDIMTYCDIVWISDYHFDRATTHRLSGDGGVILDDEANADARTGEMLVVRGIIQHGELILERSFVLTGPPALPESDGPYRVEGIGVGGQTEFSYSFSPIPTEHGGGGFVFLVPYDPTWAETLDRMVLTGPEGTDIVTRDGPPMAVVTNPANGYIQAIIRDWDGGPLPGEGVSQVQISRGIPTGERR